MEVTPGYKKTEVGVIPEEWETRRLGELLQGSRSIRYGIVQPGKYDATGCFMLRSQDYSKGWAGPDGMHKVAAQLENQYRNARIRHNDLVMEISYRIGSNPASALKPEKNPMCCQPVVYVF